MAVGRAVRVEKPTRPSEEQRMEQHLKGGHRRPRTPRCLPPLWTDPPASRGPRLVVKLVVALIAVAVVLRSALTEIGPAGDHANYENYHRHAKGDECITFDLAYARGTGMV